ncbi:MAG TPA: GNAT family N-acetyltransferase [Oscillospiraceae bacterium]|nr:GNAT family N-acetyltransferase [Oscillospiraceae bacterium]HPK34665.1 GNAT family N-acetyltransferase [Oscillospiraceae bacterium]HPR74571.1 GNAT family N-acetyltransferase [Oscillospiraceae bacterium]
MPTHTGTRTIETERLTLRRFTYQDADDMLKYWISDEKVQSLYCEPAYKTKAAVKELLGKYIGGYEKESYYRWAVILKQTGECIGQIAFFLVDDKNRFVEVEYCIGTQFQNRGYMTEAVNAVIEYGFERLNLHKIQVSHKAGNIASKRVIEKCGFVYEGTLRDYFYTETGYVDRLFYSILRDEHPCTK